jgi:hypothetical protein
MKKLGILQARGLGDILIALPIAQYYKKRGWEIYWPISDHFLPSLKDAAPWVNWLPFDFTGAEASWVEDPLRTLEEYHCEKTLSLYSYITGYPEFCSKPYSQVHKFTSSQVHKFDQYKYQCADVPFIYKWELWSCITRNNDREEKLFNKIVKNKEYFVYHRKGSDFEVSFNLTSLPQHWQAIEITEQTDNIFDWLKILENAQALVMIDSVFANLVDQLEIDVVKYWMPRSGVMFTPVLGSKWIILDAPESVKKQIQMFPVQPAGPSNL